MSKARSIHRRGLQRTVAMITPRLLLEQNVLRIPYIMHSVSRQAVCTFSAAFRVSSAPPRRCAVSHVRELQTARQSYFGTSSALKQSVITRKSGKLCGKKSTARRCILLAELHQIINIGLLLCCAGSFHLPAMALFGATATKDTLYDYTVKDAGEPISTPNLLQRPGGTSR